jgi:hypothetical protein
MKTLILASFTSLLAQGRTVIVALPGAVCVKSSQRARPLLHTAHPNPDLANRMLEAFAGQIHSHYR